MANLIKMSEKHKPVKHLYWKRSDVLVGAQIPVQFAFMHVGISGDTLAFLYAWLPVDSSATTGSG